MVFWECRIAHPFTKVVQIVGGKLDECYDESDLTQTGRLTTKKVSSRACA